MTIKYTFDVNTQQPVYAVCDSKTGECRLLTTNITDAIQAVRIKKK